jgi:hypothetical protein
MITIGECARLLSPFLNRDVQMPMKAFHPMPLNVRKEITDLSKMNNETFDFNMNVSNIARNVIESISFQSITEAERFNSISLCHHWSIAQ